MKVLTIKSADVLDTDLQTEVHHTFGMERHTDYVFKPRGEGPYSATIVLEDSGPVIGKIVSESGSFPGYSFVIDDLDMESNSIERYHVKDGRVTDQRKSGWKWD
jgi:hypothetical protein